MKKKEELAALQADVASYVAELGLASASYDGFNDADFRKKGPLKNSQVSDGKNVVKGSQHDSGKNRGKFKGGDNNNRGQKNFNNNSKPAISRNPALSSERGFDSQKKLDIPPGKENKFAKHVAYSLGARWTGEPWYEAAQEISTKLTFLDNDKPAAEDVILKRREEAEFMLKRIAFEFEQSRKTDNGMKWIMSARRSGTSVDKVAAMTVMIQENPLANLQAFDNLLGTVTSKGGKRHALGSMDVLKELFVTSLLPDRKLKSFSSQPIEKLPETKDGAMLLFFWFWEDCIKQRYKQFVDALVEGTMDALAHLKLKCIKTLYDLLNSKPELERQLLVAIVNKLGDPERKAASNSGYYLSCVLTEHPNMKRVIIQEVEQFVFRPNVGLRAIYYAAIFLNQLILSNRGDGPSIAKQLIDIYFGLFKTVTSRAPKEEAKDAAVPLKKKDKKKNRGTKEEEKSTAQVVEIDSRILIALLTGVNRAFPFVKEDDADTLVGEHTPSLFRMIHSPNLNVGIQALMLVHQLLAKHHAVSDRFHRALYTVLVSTSLAKSTKIELFLALLFKVLKADISLSRVAAFVKRLLQVALHEAPQFGCACLLLVSEVLKAKPLLWNFVLVPASENDDDEHFKDVELLEDRPDPNIESFNKEMEMESPEKEMDTVEADDSDSDMSLEDGIGAEFGDDESEDEDDISTKNVKPLKKKNTKAPEFPTANKPNVKASGTSVQSSSTVYNAQHRDPLYCNADKCCWWELTTLASHIHPSVATMARTLLCNAHVIYNGNPLQDLALGAFLDRFAERKQKPQRKTLNDEVHPKKTETELAAVGMEMATLPEDEVAPEDMIFHRFYSAKAASSGGKRKKQKKHGGDADVDGLVGSDEDDLDEDDDDDDAVIPDIGEAESEDELGDEVDVAASDEEEAEDEDEEEAADSGSDSFAGSDDSEDEEIDNFLDEEMAEELAREGDSDDDESDDDSFEFADGEGAAEKKKGSKSEVKKRKKEKKVVQDEARFPSQKRRKTGASPFASAEKYSQLVG